jgi:diguanylate cyclase (GGDEF)-like protein
MSDNDFQEKIDEMSVDKISSNSKIMIIDDSEDILFLIENILSLESFVPVPMNSARKALMMIDRSYDAIVLDLMMPEMNGLEFLKKFREKNEFRHIPVIILTAKNNNEEEIAEIFNSGANDYIVKPFLKLEFTSRIRVHVSLKKLTENLYKVNRKIKRKNEELMKAIRNEENLNQKILDRNMELKDAYGKIEELNKNLEYSATHDFLTGILNRGALLTFLENDIRRAKRMRTSLSLLIFDIDFFKRVNDNYGHIVGDFVLKQISAIVRDTIREIDLFGRYGGEEFIVILPDTTLDQATILTNRIMERIRESNFMTNNLSLKITISVGITEYIPDESVDIFINRADEALYEAKESGRNCVRTKV